MTTSEYDAAADKLAEAIDEECMVTVHEIFIERLKKLARSECYYDDEDEDKIIDDYAGGNVDDAFYAGEHAGEVMLARDVLTGMGINWSSK
jgi:hypothetical protein